MSASSSLSTAAKKALSGYRRLFRARKQLFMGDTRAMAESRIAIRTEFVKNRQVADPQHLEGLLVMIDEAEDMLLNGIVRGWLFFVPLFYVYVSFCPGYILIYHHFSL